MKTLIALFSNHWDRFAEYAFADDPDLKIRAEQWLAQKWADLLEPLPEVEVGVFLPSVMHGTDPFPSAYRRFIQVGNTLEDRIRNAFELCFEKGYQSMIFADTLAIPGDGAFLPSLLQKLESNQLVFVPNEEGRVVLAGMPLKRYPHWSSYAFDTTDGIVELISDCIAHNQPYALMEPISLSGVQSMVSRQFVSSPSERRK